MLSLVTIAEAREHLRLDYGDTGGPDDPWLEIMIPAISQAVALWLKEEWRLYVPERDTDGAIVVGEDGNPVPAEDANGKIVQPVVRAAVLIELDSQYQFRSGEGRDNAVPSDAGYGYVLNKASTALLTPLRRPTVG